VEAALSSLPRGTRVLDLGAGGGKSAEALVSRGLDVVGLDFVPRPPAAPGGASDRWVVAAAERLPFRSGALDAVLARHVLGHLPGTALGAAVEEARRVLRGGGRLLVEDLARGDLRERGGDGGIPRRFFSDEEIRDALAGWRVLALERVVAAKRYGARARIAAVAEKP